MEGVSITDMSQDTSTVGTSMAEPLHIRTESTMGGTSTTQCAPTDQLSIT